MNECQRLCSVDTKCKGYAVHKNSDTCIIATSSLCPSECHGPYAQDNLGPIDMNAEKCAQGDFNQGCYVKQSGNLNLIDITFCKKSIILNICQIMAILFIYIYNKIAATK